MYFPGYRNTSVVEKFLLEARGKVRLNQAELAAVSEKEKQG